jgi:DNA (cytosine-5)-methyltransferase 1
MSDKLKVLNLYCGIGGNRNLWEDVDVTAVDVHSGVLECYEHHHPKDTIVQADAHEYLLANYDKGFDVIWSSPPCPTNSRMMKATRHDVRAYPDMSLYQQAIWLEHFFDGEWVIENVIPYYKPLIMPQTIGRHAFWSSQILYATEVSSPSNFIVPSDQDGLDAIKDWLGIQWDKPIYFDDHDPAKAFRNAVHPRVGLEVFRSLISAGKNSDLFAHMEQQQ